VPAANKDVVMLGAALTVNVYDAVPILEALSTTLTVKVHEPGNVGVPLIVAPLGCNPAGRLPLRVQLLPTPVPPEAASVAE
jgi:hypothetical protein